jgi:hypothetical protein
MYNDAGKMGRWGEWEKGRMGEWGVNYFPLFLQLSIH